jgi:hypothetical protein
MVDAALAPGRRAAPVSPAGIEVLIHFGGGRRGVFCEVRRQGRLIGAAFGATVREVLEDANALIAGPSDEEGGGNG